MAHPKVIPEDQRLFLLPLLICWLLSIAWTSAAARDSASAEAPQVALCAAPCGLDQPGAYPHLIVAVVKSVLTDEQSAAVFAAQRASGRWPDLPADVAAFKAHLQPVTVRVSDTGREFTVLISQAEARVLHLAPGDLMRYSPHFGAYEAPPPEAVERAYRSLSGCIAVLCAMTDANCVRGYREGVYEARTGNARSDDGLQPAPEAAGIHPVTMRPR